MKDRTLPKPEKFASCPYDGKILEYYKGQFESVFILLHPFFSLKSISIDLLCPEKWPGKHEIINGCIKISWDEILKLSGLNNISEIDIGLRSAIASLKPDHSNEVFLSKLVELENRNIILPQEGCLSPFLENRIFEAIKRLGHNYLWVGDEFCTERKLHWIDDLIEKDIIPVHGCIFTHDHTLLVTTHWDSHCSLLCSSKEIIEEILANDSFEGFCCTPETEVYWGLQKYY